MKDLYYGKIAPWERHASNNQEQIELNQKISDETRQFVQTLSVDHEQQFQKLECLYSQSSGLVELDAFTYGFQLGSNLMLEILTQE